MTKRSCVDVMKQDLLFPLTSKLDFSRELLQPSTQQPPKAPAPRGSLMLPLFHWWGMKQSFLHKWAVQHLLWSHAPSLFQRGFTGREVLQCSKTRTTWALPSRPARTCISLTRTCLLHLSGVLCLNGTGSNSSSAPNRLPVQTGTAPSQPGQGGTPLAGRAGRKPAAFSLQLESLRAKESKASPCTPHTSGAQELLWPLSLGVEWHGCLQEGT